ncbi:MAG TPA: hypothetical protein DD490_05095 [Acidobacteria bacterium]|nr:hypothetical protein [Acidobacteriota bacterium]
MRIFVSWSGERSRRLALALQEWLPFVIHSIRREDIWVSDRDIEAGRAWGRVLGDVLAETRIGLICLTHENRRAPWIHFEAGALAKHLADAKVIPLLFGLQPEDLAGSPLSQFQAVRLVESDMLHLLRSLSAELGDARISEDVLARSLRHNWPELAKQLAEIERVSIDEMEETLPGVIEVFSHRGLGEPHPGRVVHFEEGFESHVLYSILFEQATRRILVFGRKNRKMFDKEHRDFLDDLPRRLADGFDFRCLFLDPESRGDILRAAHADDDLPDQIRRSLRNAGAALANRGLDPACHFRLYSIPRTMNLIIIDDAVLFAPVELTTDGRAKPLTKCGFSVVDCRLSLGQRFLRTFLEVWDGAAPLKDL